MKAVKGRAFAMLTIGLVVACIVFTALPSTAAAQAGPGSAEGFGTYDSPFLPVLTFSFMAAGGPEGATGTMLVQSGDEEPQTAQVLCIGVTGNRAIIIGRRPTSAGGGEGMYFWVLNNGTPGAVVGDRWTFTIDELVDVSAACRAGSNRLGQAITTGEIFVQGGEVCPPSDDEDNDGLNNGLENRFFTLLGNDDSDFDGIADGNDDANGNGDDDEDEDDDEDDDCPDEDSDDDGEDDEDEDDEEDDDDD